MHGARFTTLSARTTDRIRSSSAVGRQFARDNRGLDGWLLFVFGLRPTGIGEIWLNIGPRTLITSFNSAVISKGVIAFVVMLVLIDYFTSGFLIHATKIGGRRSRAATH